MARKTENGGKFRNVHHRTWNMARKLEILEHEQHPLDDLKPPCSIFRGTVRPPDFHTKSMARNLKIMENEKHPLDYMRNDEITKKREK